jgi:Leucine-rich repeat (LRR) protein
MLIRAVTSVMTALLVLSFVFTDGIVDSGCEGTISEEAYKVLETLYNSTAGWNWFYDPSLPSATVWHFPSPLSAPCSNNWQGLNCSSTLNETTCDISSISLDAYNLCGFIPSQLGNLVNLEGLFLNNNSLNGSIPPELGNLVYLDYLDLGFNSLNGSIPSELGNLVCLEHLHLGFNLLDSSIPSELGNLVNLERLALYNNLLDGSIPSELGNILNLQLLDLSINLLDGSIPSELGNLVNLEGLTLYDSLLDGSIPSELGNLVKLQGLNLRYNSLDGSIPSELGNFVFLETLDLSLNSLDGSIPSELGKLANLEGLDVYENFFLDGSIPSELGNLVYLDYLNLGINSLHGSIPSELSNLVYLDYLNLGFNSLDGSIPSELSNLVNLKGLYLGINSLDGSIPSELSNLVNLNGLNLGTNSLGGSIPSELCNLVNLEVLFLNDNYLSGCLPSELENIVFLEFLDLATNSLTGLIPPELGSLAYLELLYLFENSLDNIIPSEMGYLAYLRYLDLDTNSIIGPIPSELGSLTSLEILLLYGNSLDGCIPSELSYLSNLTELELFDNLLVGSIPSELGALQSLETMVLYSNYLDGEIPSEIDSLFDLEVLYLYDNSLIGAVPNLNNLLNLEVIYLYDNSLTGRLDFAAFPRNLNYLDLGNNLLTGTLPSATDSMSTLLGLNLSSNKLTGSIDRIGDLSMGSLQSLDLSKNRFKGALVDSIFLPPSLRTIILSQNCFSGTLPSSMCANQRLENVIMDLLTGNCGTSTNLFQGFVLSRYMTGTIPGCLWNSSSIRILHLLGNGLSGSLSDLTTATNISILALGSNQLTGAIPQSFQSHAFEQLDLSINRLSGTLESYLLISQNATVYDLSVNRISGIIPSSLYGTFRTGVIDVLDGNLFECQQLNIPKSDVYHASYQCGSFDLEYTWIAWFTGTSIVGVSLGLLSLFGIDLTNQLFRACTTRSFWFVIAGPVYFLGISVGAMVIYVVTKLVDSAVATATHAVQYWWVSTVVFVHDWLISIMVWILLTASCVVSVVTMLGMASGINPVNPRDVQVTKQRLYLTAFVLYGAAHLLNISVVTAANAVYILVATGNITGLTLLVVQAVLGLFKLIWSTVIVPWLLLQMPVVSSSLMPHWIFMVLFIFVGSPFMSNFCESSACFYYVITSSRPMTFTFADPFPYFSPSCEDDTHGDDTHGDGCSITLSPTASTIQDEIASPWIYSFQCSSAVLTNYAPVLMLSYLVSGVLVPFSQIIVSENALFSPSLIVGLVRTVTPDLYFHDKPSAIKLLESCAISQHARKVAVKFILNLSVMLTFGLAVPLLNIAVVIDTVFNLGASVMLLNKFTRQCEYHDVDAGKASDKFWDSLRLEAAEMVLCCYIVLGFTGIFWSLFAFDWIGDVYGSLAGGLSMMVPLLTPMLIGFILLRRLNLREQVVVSRLKSVAFELQEILNPVILPQTTRDDFSAVDA